MTRVFKLVYEQLLSNEEGVVASHPLTKEIIDSLENYNAVTEEAPPFYVLYEWGPSIESGYRDGWVKVWTLCSEYETREQEDILLFMRGLVGRNTRLIIDFRTLPEFDNTRFIMPTARKAAEDWGVPETTFKDIF